MDAFTTDLAKLGVPKLASKARFQMPVAHMNVLSSGSRITTGKDLVGNIEFFPNNYGPQNAAGVPNASDAVWDFGDEIAEPERRLRIHSDPQLRRQADDLRLQQLESRSGGRSRHWQQRPERQRRTDSRLDLQRQRFPVCRQATESARSAREIGAKRVRSLESAETD